MARLLKDPLVHFVLLGAAIFWLFARLDEGARNDQRIVVPQAEVASLWQAMSMLSGTAPTEADLRQLVEPRIREEVLYREALALGLDQNDSQIRQRLVEKMTFLSEDVVAADPPTDDELAAFFEANRDDFVEPARLTLEQVYFSPSEHGTDIADVAEAALARLQASQGAATDVLGPGVTVRSHEEATSDELRGELGEAFATAVMALPVDGAWHGPIRSVFGLHLVRVSARSEARSPPLPEVHERVIAALNTERRQRANEAAYEALRARYDIVIEIPDDVRRQWQSELRPE